MAGPDLSALTSLIDFNTVISAVLSVGAALIVVYIARKAAMIFKSFIVGDGGSSFNADDWTDDEDYWRIRKEQARIDIRSKFGRYF